MVRFGLLGLALTGAFALATPVMAQTPGFDPDAACGAELRSADDTDKLMIAAWLHGFGSARGQAQGPVDLAAAMDLLNKLFSDCLQNEAASLNELMAGAETGPEVAATAPEASGGTEQEARALLERFLDPGADRVALTAALKPSPEDIAAVYDEPLAGKLVANYAQTFTPGIQIGPKPDQDSLLMFYATTAQLKSGDPVLANFPGGYKDVLPYFRGDHPIVRFKFVTAGSELGLAFDGLVYVNGHWVLMPKPWRALE